MILSDKQKEFLNKSNRRYNIKVGARRCGKTYFDVLYAIPSKILDLRAYDGLFVIFGVSRGTIERNVLQPMREIYGKDCIGSINSNNIAILFGEEVYCLGTEKVSQASKIQGTSIKYAYIDEAAKMHEDVFNMIKGSLDKEYSKCDMALNPESKNHWLKVKFIDKIEDDNIDAYVQHYTIFDNPFLDEKVRDNIVKDMKSGGDHYYNRYILGQWSNAEGLCFPEFAKEPSKYIWKGDIPRGETIIGIDYGGNKSKHAFVCIRIPRDGSKAIVLCSRTLKAEGTTDKSLLDSQVSFIEMCAKKYGEIDYVYPDCASSVHINSLREEGFSRNWRTVIRGCKKIEINERIDLQNKLFSNDMFYYIEGECDTLISALSSAMWDSKKFEDVRLDDGTSDIDSVDAYEYTIERHLRDFIDYISYKKGE